MYIDLLARLECEVQVGIQEARSSRLEKNCQMYTVGDDWTWNVIKAATD